MTTNAPNAVGSVSEKWWERKKILEWKYESPLIHSALAEKLGPAVANIVLKNDHEDGLLFVAESRWFDRRGELSDKTLHGLRAKVEQKFCDIVLAHTEVAWTDWIEVEISESQVKAEAAEGHAYIHVEYKILKRAKFPDGRDMVLDHDALYPFPKAKAAGHERDDRGYFQDSDHQFAYIPATPGNLDAVKTLVGKLGELNNRLLAVLTQRSIAETIKLLVDDRLRLEAKPLEAK